MLLNSVSILIILLYWIDNDEIDNSYNCIEKIKKEYNINIKNGKIINLNLEDEEQNDVQIDVNDTNFLKIVDEKIDYINKKFSEKNNEKEEENKKQEEVKIDKIDTKNNSDNEKNNLKKKKITRRFRVLKDCLMLLKYNGVSLKECLKNNPFQCRPFQIKNSFEFIEAVKYDKFIEMEIYLKNPDLLFSFDYYRQTGFHWAAKKNKIKAARLMIQYGKCVNQIDINHMTPLAIAAKNNN